ncbi:MAG: aminotransferase class I/II-fold pyridoxal phosphate-dependent enzyme, partial [Phycisphaerae bacterium]|nr:aminotransferase class I/II-fold pyridoxal phosphate-dependent enzyme [Phycisphaerae bacterium]
MADKHSLIADRMNRIDASGIRKVFDLAAGLADPINLSIGQPDFDVPDEIKQKAIEAIQDGHNHYTVTQGIPELREKISAKLKDEFGKFDAPVLVTCGVSAGILLSMMATVD